MDSAQKLQSLADYFRLNIAQFAKKIGVSPSRLYDIKRGQIRNFPQDLLEKILKACPEISPIWLLTGEGDMLVSSPSSSVPASEATAKAERRQSEPSMLSRFEEVVRENERLRLELESLRSSVSRRVEGEEGVLSIGSLETTHI